jgi:hypothetical protein
MFFRSSDGETRSLNTEQKRKRNKRIFAVRSEYEKRQKEIHLRGGSGLRFHFAKKSIIAACIKIETRIRLDKAV